MRLWARTMNWVGLKGGRLMTGAADIVSCPDIAAGSDIRDVEVRFDNRVSYGSPEHFHHFLWGYLLPAMHELSRCSEEQHQGERFVFKSCGPQMDPLIAEVARLSGIRIAIASESSTKKYARSMVVSRWDLFLLRPFLLASAGGESTRLAGIRDDFQRHLPEDWERLARSDFVIGFRDAVIRVRDLLLRHAAGHAHAARYEFLAGRYLILRRSKEHPYYAEGGGAEIPSYGETRRALRGIDDAVRALERRGLEVSVFEPGAHGLAGQALAFHHSRGVAMVRGAEIANLIWMRPGSPVLIVTPSAMAAFPPPHEQLAGLMGIELTEVLSGSCVSDTGFRACSPGVASIQPGGAPRFGRLGDRKADGLHLLHSKRRDFLRTGGPVCRPWAAHGDRGSRLA